MKRITNSTGYWYTGSSQDKIVDELEKKSPQEYAKIRSKVAQLSNLIRDAKNIEKRAKKIANEILDEIQKSKE
jgi:ABC-type transporter lipoprotein component MlaA